MDWEVQGRLKRTGILLPFLWKSWDSRQGEEKIRQLFKKNFILFLAALGFHCSTWAFSSCSVQELLSSCRAQASHRSDFSCCGAWALGARASVVAAYGLSSCSSRVPEHRLSSCGAFHGVWNPPGPGIEPVSPALAGGFLST